jgi:hypothetical protein
MIPDAVVLMESFYAEEFRRMQEFAAAIGVQLTTRLGSGQDGLAYATDNKSAIKALRFEQWYRKEPNVYLRLQALGLPAIAGFTIPELLRYDDELWVIETEFVVAPFCRGFCRSDTRRAVSGVSRLHGCRMAGVDRGARRKWH